MLTRDGNRIYLNRVNKRVMTSDAVIVSLILLVLIATPAILALIFGPSLLFFYIFSGLAIIMLWAFIEDDGGIVVIKTKIKSYDRIVQYTHGELSNLVDALFKIQKFRKELATLVTPLSLYNEVLDKIENYAKLVEIDSQEELDMLAYTKNLQNMVEACKKIRANNLTKDDQVLNSALTLAGINQEDD